jgi:hypothetical protein
VRSNKVTLYGPGCQPRSSPSDGYASLDICPDSHCMCCGTCGDTCGRLSPLQTCAARPVCHLWRGLAIATKCWRCKACSLSRWCIHLEGVAVKETPILWFPVHEPPSTVLVPSLAEGRCQMLHFCTPASVTPFWPGLNSTSYKCVASLMLCFAAASLGWFESRSLLWAAQCSCKLLEGPHACGAHFSAWNTMMVVQMEHLDTHQYGIMAGTAMGDDTSWVQQKRLCVLKSLLSMDWMCQVHCSSAHRTSSASGMEATPTSCSAQLKAGVCMNELPARHPPHWNCSSFMPSAELFQILANTS